MGSAFAGTPADRLPHAVQAMADALIHPGHGISLRQMRRALEGLNGERQDALAILLARAWTATQGADAVVTKHHCLALINVMAVDAAERLIPTGRQLALAADALADPEARAQVAEFSGLQGRICKQRFVQADDDAMLYLATRYYDDQYRQGTPVAYWHGVNVVALLRRQQARGLDMMSPDVDVDALAVEVIRKVGALAPERFRRSAWVAATLSEMHLALEQVNAAELWLYRFLDHPQVRSFDIDSYDRQLREIWGGSVAGSGSAPGGGNPGADRLVAIIARRLMRTEARMTMSATHVHAMATKLRSEPAEFERNFSGEAGFSVDVVRQMLKACDSIGCVCDENDARAGTGFLMEGAALCPAWGPGLVFVTNAHVIGRESPVAVDPAHAGITFETETAAGRDVSRYRVADVLFSSRPGRLGVRNGGADELDVTIVRLDRTPPGREGLTAANALPVVNARARAYVVGHPQGAPLQVSLNDSLLLDIDDEERLVHYRTPTEPGSSGSPVFNIRWQVIAIHHAGASNVPRLHGAGEYEANEGIALGAIRRALCLCA